MKRIPFDAMQRAVYQYLTKYQTTPVYDDVPPDASFPYVTFGDFIAAPFGAKAVDLSSVEVTFEIWSKQQGRKEVNGIANDLCTLVEYKLLELEDDFEVQRQSVTSFTAYPEDYGGYHGSLAVNFLILNTRQV